jgi:GxxExxY protein
VNRQEAKTPRDEPGDELDRLARAVVDSAFAVHSQLGPGLLEGVYEVCLAHELTKRGLRVERQVALPVLYDGVKIEAGLRLDLLVEEKLIVEVKAVELFHPVHKAQVLTYLKLTGHSLGLLINFNVPLIKDGIKRIILSTGFHRQDAKMPRELEVTNSESLVSWRLGGSNQ